MAYMNPSQKLETNLTLKLPLGISCEAANEVVKHPKVAKTQPMLPEN